VDSYYYRRISCRLTLHYMGLPGEVAFVVDKVHDPGRIELRQTPAMIVAINFNCIWVAVLGQSPLVQVNERFGGWLGEVEAKRCNNSTFLRMSAALGALVPPSVGALFVNSLIVGMEY